MTVKLEQFLLSPDEVVLLAEYRTLKKEGHGDLSADVGEKRMDVSVKSHGLVKLWTTHKRDLGELPKLREV